MKKLVVLFVTLSLFKGAFSQNVGIGITTPLSKLHVKGTGSGTQIVLEENAGSILRISNEPSGTGPYIGTTTNNPFSFVTNNNVRAIINASGNFGIGVSSPQQQLSVGSGIVVDQNNNNNGTSANILNFGNASGEGIGSKRNAGAGQWGLDFYTNNTHRMIVANNGNVGINVINPSSKLEVRGALGFSSTTKKWEMSYDSTNQYFYIDEFGASRRLYIKNGGNVGINQANPQTTLDVNGDVNIQNRLFLNNSPGNDGQVLVSNGSNNAPAWQDVAYSNNDRFMFTSTAAAYTASGFNNLPFTTVYTYSSAISYSNGVFTVSKSGLYSFKGHFASLVEQSIANTIPPNINLVFKAFPPSFPMQSFYIYDPVNPNYFYSSGSNTNYFEKSMPINFNYYLPTGSQFVLEYSVASVGALSSIIYGSLPLEIHLISE